MIYLLMSVNTNIQTLKKKQKEKTLLYILHIPKGNSTHSDSRQVCFCWNETVEMDCYCQCGYFCFQFIFSLPADLLSWCLSLIWVFCARSKKLTYNTMTSNLSSDVMHQEFTQTAGFEMAQGPQCGLFCCLWQCLWFSSSLSVPSSFSFLFCVSFCLLCSCQRVFPMTLMLCLVVSE